MRSAAPPELLKPAYDEWQALQSNKPVDPELLYNAFITESMAAVHDKNRYSRATAELLALEFARTQSEQDSFTDASCDLFSRYLHNYFSRGDMSSSIFYPLMSTITRLLHRGLSFCQIKMCLQVFCYALYYAGSPTVLDSSLRLLKFFELEENTKLIIYREHTFYLPANIRLCFCTQDASKRRAARDVVEWMLVAGEGAAISSYPTDISDDLLLRFYYEQALESSLDPLKYCNRAQLSFPLGIHFHKHPFNWVVYPEAMEFVKRSKLKSDEETIIILIGLRERRDLSAPYPTNYDSLIAERCEIVIESIQVERIFQLSN